MKYNFILLIFVWLLSLGVYLTAAKSVKLRTVTLKPKMSPITQHRSRVKVRKPTAMPPIQRSDIVRQSEIETTQSVGEGNQDIIQSTFNSGVKRVSEFLQRLLSRFVGSDTTLESDNEHEGTPLRIPGLPTTSIFHHIDVSSIVKLLQASDGTEAEALAENAVIDIASQLNRIIGFNDLRDWLGIIAMYFILGPILIPLFWLPISLFGMAGLLVPLFIFNPPSKLNTGVEGHDPIIPAPGEKRSLSQFLSRTSSTSSTSKRVHTSTALSPDIFESCMERVSCHLTRFYRNNPISQWLTGHFNATKIEWARVHPRDVNNDNGISSREDCKKYACSVFPAA